MKGSCRPAVDAAECFPNGTSVLAQKALEQGKANYKGFCEAYQLIMKHYGISAKVVNGKKHMENSVVIVGKNIQHQRWKLQRMQIKHILQQPSRTCGEPGNHGSFQRQDRHV